MQSRNLAAESKLYACRSQLEQQAQRRLDRMNFLFAVHAVIAPDFLDSDFLDSDSDCCYYLQ